MLCAAQHERLRNQKRVPRKISAAQLHLSFPRSHGFFPEFEKACQIQTAANPGLLGWRTIYATAARRLIVRTTRGTLSVGWTGLNIEGKIRLQPWPECRSLRRDTRGCARAWARFFFFFPYGIF